MAGINIAALVEQQKTNPDPLVAAFLAKNRIARILEHINEQLAEAYEQLDKIQTPFDRETGQESDQ
jgi:hypothetical protein